MLWLEFTAVTLLAGVVLGFTGFGGALVMAPVFMTLVDPLTATSIILIVNAVVGLANLRQVGAETDWSIAKPLAIAACLTSPIGVWLVSSIDGDLVRRIVAVIVLVASVGLALRWKFPFSIRKPIGNAVLGAASGSLFGFGGVGGPPVIIGMLAEEIPPRVTRATLLTFFCDRADLHTRVADADGWRDREWCALRNRDGARVLLGQCHRVAVADPRACVDIPLRLDRGTRGNRRLRTISPLEINDLRGAMLDGWVPPRV
ncbi:MAG: sulfite exporter TauE/SafE family protein [Gammaproteobacteria bacterium]|nr:sulfite exporter TauE/SafE family protein [Gammaproteobacteria bacterium]